MQGEAAAARQDGVRIAAFVKRTKARAANVAQPAPYRDYQSAAGFYHPSGDYSETVTDGSAFDGIWGECESNSGY